MNVVRISRREKNPLSTLRREYRELRKRSSDNDEVLTYIDLTVPKLYDFLVDVNRETPVGAFYYREGKVFLEELCRVSQLIKLAKRGLPDNIIDVPYSLFRKVHGVNNARGTGGAKDTSKNKNQSRHLRLVARS